ncbi:MAG TPA: translation initiation factor [Bacteroidales bacterium]|nr:translation initiation factor [Bacteroidales bacterium]
MKKNEFSTDNKKFTLGDLLQDKGFTTSEEEIINNADESADETIDYNAKIRVIYQKKGRGNNPVTIIDGLELSGDDIKSLAKELKQKLAVGGSVENSEIILQGDQVEKTINVLKSMGYRNVKKG